MPKPTSQVLSPWADSWVLAAFLLLFSATVALSVPSGPSAVPQFRLPAGSADGAQAEHDQGSVIRAQLFVVRALRPNQAGGKNSLVAGDGDVLAPLPASFMSPRGTHDHTRYDQRAFRARAPPHLTA